MFNNPNDLLAKIEYLRKKMTEVALTKGFTSSESVAISQELDKLLNHYQELKKRNVSTLVEREK